MEKQIGRILFSIFLIALGVLILLSNLNLLPFDFNNNEIFWMVAFGVGGMAFLATLVSNVRENWWAAIPGFTLLGLAMLVGLPVFQGVLGGAVFLGMIGLSFLVIFLVRREHWWAIIPGGALLSLAGVTLLSQVDGMLSGGFLFVGLAITFLIIYFLPTATGRNLWAIWPAGVLGVMGLLIMSGAGGLAGFIWPAILLLAGGLLIYRAMRSGERFR